MHSSGARTSARLRAATLAVAAGALLAGCESDAETPPGERAVVTSEVLIRACAESDPLVALETLTAPLEAEFVEAESVGAACARLLGNAVELADPVVEVDPAAREGKPILEGIEEAAVTAVEVSGGFAHATVESPAGSTELELELGPFGWLIAGSS